MSDELQHIVSKARSAYRGHRGVLSTGEKLAAALVLNRPDWLDEDGYSIVQALDRIGDNWVALLPAAARILAAELDSEASADRMAKRELSRTLLFHEADGDEPVRLSARLVTQGYSPGHRSVDLTFDLTPVGSTAKYRAEVRVGADDGEEIVRHILEVHRFAWQRSAKKGPIDQKEGEQRPDWINLPARPSVK
jgi:hypothetical protein